MAKRSLPPPSAFSKPQAPPPFRERTLSIPLVLLAKILYDTIMKIDGPNQKSKTSAVVQKSSALAGGAVDPSMFLGLVGAAGESSGFVPTSATQNIAALDVLLTVQSTENPTERAARGRMTDRADEILSRLDHLRLGMLTGTMTVGQMIDMADVVAAHRDKVHDPHLTAVLDEIDLRAQVELAKLRMGLTQG